MQIYKFMLAAKALGALNAPVVLNIGCDGKITTKDAEKHLLISKGAIIKLLNRV